jgi:anaerobic magnesium-protoporphyrin IX monomethyl ester cyclase
MGGEYTFLAPPLGVWRLCGVLCTAGHAAEVFDPNCCDGAPEDALRAVLAQQRFDLVGVSTTGMTLRYDLALAHVAKRAQPDALLVAGGMEATFDPGTLFALAPIDLVVLGEGEFPVLELLDALAEGRSVADIRGTASFRDGAVRRTSRTALSREELRDATYCTPYEDMPYERYWRRLEKSYRVRELPVKAHREAHLAEIRSVRLNTLNYCPMNCSFCSSTNFLHEAQGGDTAKVGRLTADECLVMLERIVAAHPDVRTIIFQDDIFVFTSDKRIVPLCEKIVAAKRAGDLPEDLQFISTNRIDSMSRERLAAMRAAGFRVLGFGIESFAKGILEEFNKARIHPHIETNLRLALEAGVTPFLDMILTSPRCTLGDLAENIRQAYRWIHAGCEVGMYPYVIPFSGAAMARDPELVPHTIYATHEIAGTDRSWRQPAKILPIDPAVRDAILAIEGGFETWIKRLSESVSHLPSRVRSLLWVFCAVPVLARAGEPMPSCRDVAAALLLRLPSLPLDSLAALELAIETDLA